MDHDPILKKIYEVIVIGLGPAGANAAYHLASAGIDVLALEHKTMPRQKTCAGGVTAKAFPLLDFDYSAAVESNITAATVCFRHGQSLSTDENIPVGCVVNRATFDHLLAKRAERAGARIQDAEPVRELIEHKDFLEVKTSRASYKCRFVVGADGAHGITSKFLGRKGKPRAIGIEVHVPDDYEIIRDHANRLSIYFGDLKEGYGWIFPHAHGASVGIGVFADQAAQVRNLLGDFLENLKLPRELALQARGHGLPVYWPVNRQRYKRRHILLAGDAGGFIDPVTGEGIYYALASGKAAAEAIAATMNSGNTGRKYTKLLKHDVLKELSVTWKIALPLYAFPERSYRAFSKHRELRNLYFDILAGRASHAELFSRIRQRGISVLGALITRMMNRH